MAEVQELDAEVETDTAASEEAAQPVRNRKKVAVGVAVAVVLLLGAVGATYALMGNDEASESQGRAGGGPETFVDIPALTVNLRSADGTPHFLRVHLMLVPSSARWKDEVTQKLPLIIDAYQPFLRELRPEDLAGSAAAFRLKEEMLIRANREVGEGAVADVLIQDLVQQ